MNDITAGTTLPASAFSVSTSNGPGNATTGLWTGTAPLADGNYSALMPAVASLGGIGEAARSAAPMLAALLSNPDPDLQCIAAQSLAEIRFTPEEALPNLLRLKNGTNYSVSILAAVALWNRDNQDPDLCAHIVAALHGERRTWVVRTLANLGTNAAPLATEIKTLLDDPNPYTRQHARRALRKIQPSTP